MNLEPFRLIIAGSRNEQVDQDRIYTWVDWAMRSWSTTYDWSLDDVQIVSGGAKGIDACGEVFSRTFLKREPKVFPADWDRYGKVAGHKRNQKMAGYAEGALIFMKNPTPGSSNMLAWMALYEKHAKVIQL
jgi:hypothetical protein